jgi:small subunit ribosomal protein S1
LSFSHDDFLQALDQHDYRFEVGQTVKGKVINWDTEFVYIDIGGKATALLPANEVILAADQYVGEILPKQSEREFLIIRAQNQDGQITLSLKQLEMKALWTMFLAYQEDQSAFSVKVTGVNKGGLTVDAKGMRAFIPRSHVVGAGEDLEGFVGQTLTVTVLEADPEKRRLVCSQKLAQRQQRLKEFEIGQLVEGSVREIRPYGVMVDLGGAVGLLHLNEYSEQRPGNLQTKLPSGTPIKAIITNIEAERGRISLSTKVLENRPGEMLDGFEHVMAEAEQRATHAVKKLNPLEAS